MGWLSSDEWSQRGRDTTRYSALTPDLAYQSFEYEYDYSPGWRFAVKNFRWTDRLQGIADGYLKRMFGVPEEEPVPPVSSSPPYPLPLSSLLRMR